MNEISVNNEINEMRSNWTASEIEEILDSKLIDLIYRAQTVHRRFHPEGTVQLVEPAEHQNRGLQGRLQILLPVGLITPKKPASNMNP